MVGIFSLVRGRDRTRNFVKGSFGRLKPGANGNATCQDLLWTSLTALKTPSDAFPPLIGVVGAVVAILEISKRITHSKKDARELAQRSVDLLKVLDDIISNLEPGTIPEPMVASIVRFESTLKEIQTEMDKLMARGCIWRLKHLNRNEGMLEKFHKRLDDASHEFKIASAARAEICVHQVHAQVLDNKKEIFLLRRIILVQSVFFLAIPRWRFRGAQLDIEYSLRPASPSSKF
ncbi:hypothetical protein MVEN_01390900 [Mycena venus]|uniref:Uncharacterized protein n=1 Tax=Mycena venus TaxID=2733690 RepID=A0A8H6XV20_9AGAR|nr:hypothetical protein MVEN_01390900 [Mycena venus]